MMPRSKSEWVDEDDIAGPYTELKDEENEPPGIKVVLAHQLAPYKVRLAFGNNSFSFDKEVKYNFKYNYLDIYFTIRTDDDKTAAKLFPFFTNEQKIQIMAMTLGAKEK